MVKQGILRCMVHCEGCMRPLAPRFHTVPVTPYIFLDWQVGGEQGIAPLSTIWSLLGIKTKQCEGQWQHESTDSTPHIGFYASMQSSPGSGALFNDFGLECGTRTRGSKIPSASGCESYEEFREEVLPCPIHGRPLTSSADYHDRLVVHGKTACKLVDCKVCCVQSRDLDALGEELKRNH